MKEWTSHIVLGTIG